MTAEIATRLGRPLPGRDLHPLEQQTFMAHLDRYRELMKMTISIDPIYENGVLKLSQPLREHEAVRVSPMLPLVLVHSG